jgi:predicted alpha/beta superfamily hydrolase
MGGLMNVRNCIVMTAGVLSLFAGVIYAGDGLVSGWPVAHGFSYEWDVGLDSAVFLVGSAEEIGGWNPAGGVRLTWTSGNVWTGNVALPAGQEHTYKFVKRSMQSSLYCEPTNAVWMEGDDLVISNVPVPICPYAGKQVSYCSRWSNVVIRYRCGDTQWVDAAMTRVGEGRQSEESYYRITGIASNDMLIEFVFRGMSNGVEVWDNAPYEGPAAGSWNYYTMLDVFHVQDKQVFNYAPMATQSAARIEERLVGSTVAEIPERTIRIYLPRGYDEETWKRYPVFYMHDGQEIFCGVTPRSDQWNADFHATREIGQGRMRECIIVGIDNSANRQAEYEVSGDRYYDGYPEGIGDKYLEFFVANVRPTLDYNYRTLTDSDNTFVGGSSMGGLISIYFGYATNLFGSLMAMSPAITRAPNYTAELWNETKRDVRIYVDTGSDEGSVGTGGGDYWYKPWEVYAVFLQQGYAVNDDLLMRIGCGDHHDEAAWSSRYTGAVRFLLDVRREANRLAQQAYPPYLEIRRFGGEEVSIAVSTLYGYRSELQFCPSLKASAWQTNATSTMESSPWGETVFTNIAQTGYRRAAAVPAF